MMRNATMLNRMPTLIVLCFIITACANQATSAPTSISTSTSAPSLGAHFPQLATPPEVHLEALINGKLVLENGCLRVSGVAGAVNGSTFLLIWDQRFSTRTEQGIVQVIDVSTGEVLASVGDFVAVGGGFVGNPTSRGLKEPIPDECPGSYFLVGESIKKIERPSLGAHFPQLNNPQSASTRTAIKGKLVLENGCLRINGMGEAVDGDSVLLIWHLTVSTRAEQGVVQVIDSETGKVLVSMDDFVAVEGGFIDDPTSWGLLESLPEECLGPYFLVGDMIKKIDGP